MKSSSRDFWETFPLLTVKDSIIVSKRGDLTLGWKVSLPPAYTIDRKAYTAFNRRLESAIRALPPWMIVHRQDLFLKRRYIREEGKGFLSERYERHFDSREYLGHGQRIYLTLTGRESAMRHAVNSGIYGFPAVVDGVLRKDVTRLRNAAAGFAHMIGDSGLVILRQMDDDELIDEIQTYLDLGEGGVIPTDRMTSPDGMESEGKELWTYSMSEARHLPGTIAETMRAEPLCTGEAGIHLSTGSCLGMMLGCEHIVNAFFLTVPASETEKNLKKSLRDKTSMSKRSIENTANAKEIEEYGRESHEKQLVTVLAHNNLIVWARKGKTEDVSALAATSLAMMGITCTRNTYDSPVVWYASIPGACAELGKQNFRTAELYSCLCMNINETYQRDIPGGILKLCDRIRNIPLRVDFQEAAEKAGLVTNYNAFILGPSGSGKSFFTNHLTRSLYDDGQTVAIIDMGDSYEGLCSIIREESGGRDGIYLRWDPERPISFDAFRGFGTWLRKSGEKASEAILERDHEGVLFLMSIIKYMWSPAKGWLPQNETILGDIIEDFARQMDGRKPLFGDLYDHICKLAPEQKRTDSVSVGRTSVDRDKFDLEDLSMAMKNYAPGQSFGFLYNNMEPEDIFTSRFTVFEIAELSQKGDRTYYPLVVLGMISAFDSLMRRSGTERKALIIEEAWKAIANEEMSGFLRELWKTSRKYNTSAIVVSQQFSDLLAAESVKDTILQNSDTKLLLSQKSNIAEIQTVASYFGLNEHEKAMLLSIGQNQDPRYTYREAFVSLGGRYSAVYATELSPQEGIVFQTNKQKKEPYMRAARQAGYRAAADMLSNSYRDDMEE